MIPYVHVRDIRLISADAFARGWPTQDVAVRPFGALVALAVLTGAWLSLRQAKRLHLDQRALIGLMYSVVIGGFIGGHVLDVIFYHPDLAFEQPWLLTKLSSGQSSFGGFVGATLGACLWSRFRRRALGPFAEVIASSFPAAWVIGRFGCAVVHDHPGVLSEQWFAVAFPGGARLDLGLIEALAMIPLALAALRLRRTPRPAGFFVGLMCLYYAPLRFTLDLFRARDVLGADPRYAGLTPAQWGACLLFGLGLYFSLRSRQETSTGAHSQSVPRAASRGANRLGLEREAALPLERTDKTAESKRTT